MKVRCPEFRKHNDWEIQSGAYPCYVLSDPTITFSEPVCKRVYHCYADGVRRMTITPYSMTLYRGYACDGSSNSPDVADDPVLGDNMLAAFFHDAGYQFSEVPLFRELFPRPFWDNLHLEINRARRFKLKWTFRLALWAFGWRSFGARRKSGARLEVVEADRKEGFAP